MTELTDQELMQATDEEIEFYNKCIEGLPPLKGFRGDFLDKDGIQIPFGSGPHIVKHFKEAIEIVNPISGILEIGFNIGYGSALLLELSDVPVWSCDISEKWETKYAELFLRNKYEIGFTYWQRKYMKDENLINEFDLVFIDGAHDEKSIIEDIELAKFLEIPYLLFDDWYPRFGETQKAVVKFPELELVKDMSNLRLYKVNYGILETDKELLIKHS